jgi:3-oxoacyl-[acyl-carrier protein] reductase
VNSQDYNITEDFDVRVRPTRVLVTGGSRGIGLAIAEQLVAEGKQVTVCSREYPANNWNHRIQWFRCDVLEPEDISALINRLGEMDILINNVGGGGRWGEDKLPEDFNEWGIVYQKNTDAAIEFTCAFLPHMRAQKWGRVITISSIYGKEGGGKPWFTMAKAAEIAFMKSMAMQKIPGVTFNTIAPGYINVDGKPYQEGAGTTEDMAHLVSFLCSDKAKHINGACIVVDGGESRSF